MIPFVEKHEILQLKNHLPPVPLTPRDLAGITQISQFSRNQGPDSTPAWMKDI